MKRCQRNSAALRFVFAILAISCFASDRPLMAQAGGENHQTDEEIAKIEKLLTSQDAAWNRGDIESFMETYWKSEQLTFSGGGKTTRGWKGTLEKYKSSYPKDKMGKLHFDGLETTLLAPGVALVLGNWHLDIQGEKKDGNFSLVLKKMKGEWRIIHDHSSTLEKEKGWLTREQTRTIGASKLGIPTKFCAMHFSENWAMIEVDMPGPDSGFETDPLFVNRQTGDMTRQRPAVFR